MKPIRYFDNETEAGLAQNLINALLANIVKKRSKIFLKPLRF